MEVRWVDGSAFSKTLRQLMNSFDEFYWAVAWGSKNPVSNELTENKKKIRKLIFGTHFYQTDPDLLEDFQDEEFARVVANDGNGTFHPKIYLFTKGEKSAALVGSANFTNGAMSRNKEGMLLLQELSSSEIIMSIRSEIDGYWKSSKKIDEDFLRDYRLNHIVTSRYRKELSKVRKNSKPSTTIRGLRIWTWEKYAKNISGADNVKERLELLQEARQMFSTAHDFSRLEPNQRRAIAGFLEKGRDLSELSSMGWGWFGSMKGMGDFKNLILTNNEYISEALEHIPLTGEIRREQYDNYIVLFKKAFARKTREGGVPTASRLLAMKRPDTFLCVNSRNKRGLSVDLGFSPSTLDFQKYWDQIIESIKESVWWQADRPGGKQGKLWDGRAAMLDSIYYKER